PERSARTSLPLTSSTAPAATPLYTLSLHDALPISVASRASAATRSGVRRPAAAPGRGRRARFARSSSATSQSARPTARSAPSGRDRKSTRLNSSHVSISYAVFCLKKKNTCLEGGLETSRQDQELGNHAHLESGGTCLQSRHLHLQHDYDVQSKHFHAAARDSQTAI